MGVAALSGNSAARRSGPNRRCSTRSFQRPIHRRKPDCAWAVFPVATSTPVATVVTNWRRVMRLGTRTSCEHREQGTRVEGDHHQVPQREQGEETESEQMDRPCAIIASEETPEPPE